MPGSGQRTLHIARGLLVAGLLVAGCDDGGRLPAGGRARTLLDRAPDEAERAQVDLEARTLDLPAGATVRYRVESPRAHALRVVGSAESAGELTLSVHVLDRARAKRTGDEVGGARLRGADFDRVVAFEVSAGVAFELELGWQHDERGRLAVDVLELLESGPTPPPILFVSADTLTARHLSVYGYPRPTSPNLDAFAEEAVTFEHARSNAPWTLPSYISQFCGLYSTANTEPFDPVRGPGTPEGLDPQRWSLAESLRAAGYRTAAFTGNAFFAGGHRLEQGFDEFVPPTPETRRLSELLPRARSWIESLREADTPFVFVNAVDTHGPYEPPEPFRGTFSDDDSVPRDRRRAPVARNNRAYVGYIPLSVVHRTFPSKEAVPDEMRIDRVVDLYDEEILALDASLGELFDAWKAAGLWERSVVVVSADHGESMGRRDWLFSHRTLLGEVTHVPLVIKLPHGRLGGARVEPAVQLVDLYPTLIELAGLRSEGRELHGRSLLPLLAPGGSLPSAPLVSEGGSMRGALVELEDWRLLETRLGYASPAVLLTHPRGRAWLEERSPELARFRLGIDDVEELGDLPFGRMIGRMAADFAAPHYELFDLSSDPLEEVDVAAEHPERVAALRALLDAERARAAAARLETTTPVPEPSAEQLQELRDLGYVGDE